MRVTGGALRGRILKVPQTGTVRPTSDKMRQQLYNMLMHSSWAVDNGFSLPGAYALDGFCGSGGLGIEALSRGAAHCIFVDADARVMQITKDNIKTLKLEDQCEFFIKNISTIGVRPEHIAPRTLVLFDPPYRKDLIEPALKTVVEGLWLEQNCLVIAESEKGFSCLAPAALKSVHVRSDGDSQLNVWQYSA